MSCIQVTPCRVLPSTGVSKYFVLSRLPSKPCSVRFRSNKSVRTSLKMTANVSKYSPVVKQKHRAPVCLFAGGGLSDNGAKGSQSQPLEKKSIEEIIREQIQKQEYAEDPYANSGGKPPRGGGGRGRGRGRGRGWGDESEGKDMNEALQVALATIGFVLVYLATICGEDVILLGRDYIKFISTGNRTRRLRKAMEWFSERWPGSHKRMSQRNFEEYGDDEADEYAFQ